MELFNVTAASTNPIPICGNVTWHLPYDYDRKRRFPYKATQPNDAIVYGVDTPNY